MPTTISATSTDRVRGVLYHSAVGPDHGDDILPMHVIRDRHPDLYGRHRSHYDGREWVLEQPVPPLDCRWGDVVFFSPVDSQLIFEALAESGRDVTSKPFPTMDAGVLDPARTCIRLMRKSSTGPEAEPADADDYLPYTTATLRAVSRISYAAVQRLRTLGADEPWLPWVDVPHILHRGPVPIRHLRKPEVEDPERPVRSKP